MDHLEIVVGASEAHVQGTEPGAVAVLFSARSQKRLHPCREERLAGCDKTLPVFWIRDTVGIEQRLVDEQAEGRCFDGDAVELSVERDEVQPLLVQHLVPPPLLDLGADILQQPIAALEGQAEAAKTLE